MIDEAKRARIYKALREASDQKALRGGRALGILERAWQDAADLPKPWRALCAYRLAHVLMRDAPAADLHRVDELFAQAAQADCLGPWPQLYRVAVVARLAGPGPQRAALKRAAAAVKEWRTRVEHASAEGEAPREARLQDDVFNLLELASYFVGGSYDALDGLGEPASGQGNEGYRVVTSDPASATVSCTRAFARDEMHARAEEAPDAILFELARAEKEARWKRPGREWERVDHRWLRLLASLGAGRARNEDALRACVYGDSDHEDRAKALVRKIKSRVRKELRMTKPPYDEHEGVLCLHVPIIGAVHWRTLTTPPDPPDPPVTPRSHPSS